MEKAKKIKRIRCRPKIPTEPEDDGLPSHKDGPGIVFGSYYFGKRKTAKKRLTSYTGKKEKVSAVKRDRVSIEYLMEKYPESEIDKLVGEKTGVITTDKIAELPDVARQNLSKEVYNKERAIFVPNEGPQTEFLASSEREVLFASGRGSGKSYSLMVDPLRYCSHPEFNALILRSTIPELRDIIYKAQNIYPRAFPGCKFKSQENMFLFPSGARINFGYAESVSDLPRYKGQNYTWIGIDEVAQFNFYDELMISMRGSLRTTDPVKLPLQLRMTANPGDISSDKVKKEFIDPSEPGKTFFNEVHIPLPNGTVITERISKKYIRATIHNNPYLLKDNSYLAMLASLPPVKRKQWLEGDFEVSEGAAFQEFEKSVHVVQPFPIPDSWARVRGMDWGYKQPGCILWLAYSPEGTVIVYREFYFKEKPPLQVAYEGKAKEIGENVRIGILDVSSWDRHSGNVNTPGMVINRLWPAWLPSSRAKVNNKSSRIAGKMQVHQMLSLNPETGRPNMVIFPNCVNIIKQLAGLRTDTTNPEDVDTHMEDHAYDALRYGLQTKLTNKPVWFSFGGGTANGQTNYRPVDSVFGY